eukprot:1298946-Alexandrium_andersonii.AAC.1
MLACPVQVCKRAGCGNVAGQHSHAYVPGHVCGYASDPASTLHGETRTPMWACPWKGRGGDRS